jgi:capsule polysaccharide export protein KpsE/RkpR
LLDFIKIDKSYLQLETVLGVVENKTKLNGDFFWKKRAFNYQFMLPLHEIEYFFQHYQDKLNIMGYAQT